LRARKEFPQAYRVLIIRTREASNKAYIVKEGSLTIRFLTEQEFRESQSEADKPDDSEE